LKGLAMEHAGIFYGRLAYFVAILYIWYVVPRKIWQPWTGPKFYRVLNFELRGRFLYITRTSAWPR
jgi:hypothetical protein